MKTSALAVLTAASLLLFGCSKSEPAAASAKAPAAAPALTPIIVQLDWVPEPEHGGLFQAQARGWFREAGLDVTLVPGGPNALVNQRIATLDDVYISLQDLIQQTTETTETQLQELMNWAHEFLTNYERISGRTRIAR